MNNEIQKRLMEIRERLDRATVGPWIDQGGYYVRSTSGNPQFDCKIGEGPIDNVAFVAHARQDIPWLLEQLIKKDETCDWLNMAIDGFRSQLDQTLKQLDEANAELKAQMISEDNVGESVRNRWMAIVAERDAEIDRLKKALNESQDEKTLLATCYCSQLDGGYRCDSCKERIKKYGE